MVDVDKKIAGMEAKLRENKRFLGRYRLMRQHNSTLIDYNARLVCQNEKLIRVLTAISQSEEGIDTVPELAKYADRVVRSMGY